MLFKEKKIIIKTRNYKQNLIRIYRKTKKKKKLRKQIDKQT